MAYGDLLNEDRLFELYDIMLGYVADGEREELAQHIRDWLRAWDAPSTVIEGIAEHDPYLSSMGKEKKYGSDEYDPDEEDAEHEEEEWDE